MSEVFIYVNVMLPASAASPPQPAAPAEGDIFEGPKNVSQDSPLEGLQLYQV